METFFIFLDYETGAADEYGGWGVEYFKIKAKDFAEAKQKAAILLVLGEHKWAYCRLDKIASKAKALDFTGNLVDVWGVIGHGEPGQETVRATAKEKRQLRDLCSLLKKNERSGLEKMLGGKLEDFYAGRI